DVQPLPNRDVQPSAPPERAPEAQGDRDVRRKSGGLEVHLPAAPHVRSELYERDFPFFFGGGPPQGPPAYLLVGASPRDDHAGPRREHRYVVYGDAGHRLLC